MLKVIELFAGIGAVHKALKNLNLEFEILDAVEIDKKVISMYNAIHKTNFVACDINEWNKNIECDFLHASTPCTAFSSAGKQLGANDKKNGFVLWNSTLRIIKQTKPKIVTLENVKGLLHTKHKKLVQWYIDELNKLGYKTEYKILNAKDFSIPQNRERVFFVSYKKELNLKNIFEFKKFEPTSIKNILDANEKWCETKLSETVLLNNKLYFSNKLNPYKENVIEFDLNKLNNFKQNEINKIATLMKNKFYEFKENLKLNKIPYQSSKNFISINGITKTLRASIDATFQNKIMKLTPIFQQDSSFNLVNNSISQALVASNPCWKNKIIDFDNSKIVYRKLNALECIRLMGFKDKDYKNLVKNKFSKSAICKAAGNSIVVNCFENLLKNIFKESYYI